MKTKQYLLAGLGFLLCWAAQNATAQDLHFSQFWETPLLRNPSLLGMAKGDYEATALYREQWKSIGSAFSTALLHAQVRRPVRLSQNDSDPNDYLSFGLAAYTDRSGSIGLRTTAVYPAIAFNKSLGGERQRYLSLGFTGGYLQRSFDVSQMTVDNQWINGGFVAGAATRENLPNPKLQTWDLGAGLTYSSAFGMDNRHMIRAGLAAFNLTRPRWNFRQEDPPVNRATRWNASLSAAFRTGENWQIESHVNLMWQGKATELVGGAIVNWLHPTGRYDNNAFSIGAGAFYRYQDALTPVVRLNYRNFTLTAAYDVTVSTLRAATALRGGYEMSLLYSGLFYDPKSERGRTSCTAF